MKLTGNFYVGEAARYTATRLTPEQALCVTEIDGNVYAHEGTTIDLPLQ